MSDTAVVPPRPASPEKEFAFLLSDVARLLRTLTDHHARELGSTRAQWAVLVRISRCQGVSQSELAEMLDIQPITLTRLIDRLCEEGLVERRADAADRRVKRLHLLPAAGPVLDDLGRVGTAMMNDVLAGIDADALRRLIADLGTIKTNLRTQLRIDSAQSRAKAS